MHLRINSQFDIFLKNLVDSLQISDSLYELAEKRYKSIGEWLNRDASKLRVYSPDVYSQGSFRLGTVTEADEFDLDLVCLANLTKNQVSQSTLKPAYWTGNNKLCSCKWN